MKRIRSIVTPKPCFCMARLWLIIRHNARKSCGTRENKINSSTCGCFMMMIRYVFVPVSRPQITRTRDVKAALRQGARTNKRTTIDWFRTPPPPAQHFNIVLVQQQAVAWCDTTLKEVVHAGESTAAVDLFNVVLAQQQ